MVDVSEAAEEAKRDRANTLERMTTLALREAEVQAWKESGYTHEEIGELLGMEKGTVDSHAHRITKKASLAYHTTEQLMSYDELEPFDFTPLLEELVELARSGAVEDATIIEGLETVILSLEGDGFRKSGWHPDYNNEEKKNLLVTE